MNLYFNFTSDGDKNKLSKKEIIRKGISFYIIAFLVVTITILFVILVLNIFKIDTSTLFSPLKTDIKELREKGFFYAAFMIVLVGPLVEEIAFRLGLSFTRRSITLSIVVLAYILLSLITGSTYFEKVAFKLIVSLLIGFIIHQIPQKFWNIVKNKKEKSIIWISVLLFAFLHINNYAIDINILPMYFLMCLPQLVMGITLVYFRLNLGFFYGVAFHSLLNAISFILSI